MQTLQQDLRLKEPEIRALLEKGKALLEEASPSNETRAIQDTLQLLEEEWGDLKQTVGEREDSIGAASHASQAFQQSLDKMVWWLGTAEEKLKKLEPESLDKASVAAKVKELQVRHSFLILQKCDL